MTTQKHWSWRRLWPVGVIVLGAALVIMLDLGRFLNLDSLRLYHGALREFVATNYLLAMLSFVAIYAVVVALSLPGGVPLTLTGGYLFGAIVGTGLVVAGATLGAVTLFLAARSSLAVPLRARAGPWLGRLEAGFRQDAWSYMLILRLVPLFPFFVVNLVPAFLGVSLRCYAVTTFFGIIPGTFVYALVGSGLGDVLAAGEQISLDSILSPAIIVGLIGLALLAALPIVVRQIKKARNRKHE